MKQLFIGIFGFILSTQAFADLALYTDRPTARMQVLADKFLAETGVKVQILEQKTPDLIARIKAEGESSPADVVYVKDAVYLAQLVGSFSKLESSYINKNVRSSYKDDNNLWTFVTVRARTLVYDQNFDVSQINSYEDLANNKYVGTLCLRTSQSTYNQALFSDLLVSLGIEKTKNTINGMLDNLAVPTPFADDTALLNAIAQGQCSMGIANTYYLGLLLNKSPHLPIKVKFLNQGSQGVHVNGTGAGVYKYSKQKQLANKFIEYLLSDEAQLFLTGEHMDYPAKSGLSPKTLVVNFGSFNPSQNSWSKISSQFDSVKTLFVELGYQ